MYKKIFLSLILCANFTFSNAVLNESFDNLMRSWSDYWNNQIELGPTQANQVSFINSNIKARFKEFDNLKTNLEEAEKCSRENLNNFALAAYGELVILKKVMISYLPTPSVNENANNLPEEVEVQYRELVQNLGNYLPNYMGYLE